MGVHERPARVFRRLLGARRHCSSGPRARLRPPRARWLARDRRSAAAGRREPRSAPARARRSRRCHVEGGRASRSRVPSPPGCRVERSREIQSAWDSMPQSTPLHARVAHGRDECVLEPLGRIARCLLDAPDRTMIHRSPFASAACLGVDTAGCHTPDGTLVCPVIEPVSRVDARARGSGASPEAKEGPSGATESEAVVVAKYSFGTHAALEYRWWSPPTRGSATTLPPLGG
jgi:hypothetical protein